MAAHIDLEVDDDSKSLLNKPSKPGNTSRKKTLWEWISTKPLSKLPFIYFVIALVSVPALAIFHLMDPDTSYLMCAAYIAVNLFGVKHFYTLIALKKQVDDFGSLNQKFSVEHGKLSQHVHKLTEANNSLHESRDRIQAANVKNRENLSQFHGIQDTMKALNLSSIEELEDVSEKAFSIGNKWQSQLIERERDMLHTVFDRYELRSQQQDGMTQKEFKQFSAQLPVSYQQRFARLGTFRKIAGDGKILKFCDFDAALDVFAEMEALDADIEFSINTADKHTLDNDTDDSDDPDDLDISMMKRWKTTRKAYHNVSREIVKHSTDFISRKAKDFTTSLGILNEEKEEKEEFEKEEDDFDEDMGYFSGDNLRGMHSVKSEGGVGGLARSGSIDEVIIAGRMESENRSLLNSQYK